jgi:hypothetical protein
MFMTILTGFLWYHNGRAMITFTGRWIMNPDSYPKRTRIWWDGGEVEFIRWTEKSLVFNWGDPRETAIHMPRGAVMRLMEKGVLRVEGEMPPWSGLQLVDSELQAEDMIADQGLQRQPPPAFKSPVPTTTVEKQRPLGNRLNIVARLIRKLAGGEERGQAGVTG